jgi:nuclear RNA export factor
MSPNVSKDNLVTIHCVGWQGSSQEAFIQHCAKLVDQKRKKKSPNVIVKIQSIEYDGETMILRVENNSQAKLLAMCSGAKFHGQKLNFTVKKLPPGSKIIPALQTFVKSRWNPHVKLCDLSNMQQDSALMSAGIGDAFGETKKTTTGDKLGAVICKLLGNECPGLISLRLDRCNLKSFEPFATLFQTCPTLQNLSVAWNRISSLDDLLPLRNAPLRELVLLGNPVRERDINNASKRLGSFNDPTQSESSRYRSAVVSIFPQLQILDDLPVGLQEEEDEKPSGSIAGLPVLSGFVDGEETNGLLRDFLGRFFPLFDSNREMLKSLYHPTHSRFSVIVSTKPPPNRQGRGRGDDVSDWFKWNKSLSRYPASESTSIQGPTSVGRSDRRITHTFEGGEAIVKAFSGMPSTRHPGMEGMSSTFLVDAWQMSVPLSNEMLEALFVSIHGEFIEPRANSVKSFDRTFILIPSAQGSEAFNAGWGYMILNDELCVRLWGGNGGWKHATPQSFPHAFSLVESTTQLANINLGNMNLATGAPVTDMFPWYRMDGSVDLTKLHLGFVNERVHAQDVLAIAKTRTDFNIVRNLLLPEN